MMNQQIRLEGLQWIRGKRHVRFTVGATEHQFGWGPAARESGDKINRGGIRLLEIL
jgi:hypothetical protein